MCDSHSCTIYCWLIYVNYVCGKRLHTSYKHIFSAACKAKTILTVCGIVRCSFHRILLFVFKFTFQHVEIPVVMGRKKFNMQLFTLTHMQKRKPECFVKLNRQRTESIFFTFRLSRKIGESRYNCVLASMSGCVCVERLTKPQRCVYTEAWTAFIFLCGSCLVRVYWADYC